MACHYYGAVATSNMLLKQLFLIVNFCVQEGPIRNENFL